MFGGFNITGIQAHGLLALEDKFLDKKNMSPFRDILKFLIWVG